MKIKEEVETLNKKLHALTDEELAQVSGGNTYVNELTDELIKSGNFRVSCDDFMYKGEKYTYVGPSRGMAIYESPTGKKLLIPGENVDD